MKTALLHHLFHHWKLSSVDREQNVDYLKSGIDVGGRTGDDRWGAGGGGRGLKFGKGRKKKGVKIQKEKIHMVPPLGKARDGSRPYHRAKYWAPLSRVGHKTPRKVRACKCHGDHPLPVRSQDTPRPTQGCTLRSVALRCRRQLPNHHTRGNPCSASR